MTPSRRPAHNRCGPGARRGRSPRGADHDPHRRAGRGRRTRKRWRTPRTPALAAGAA